MKWIQGPVSLRIFCPNTETSENILLYTFLTTLCCSCSAVFTDLWLHHTFIILYIEYHYDSIDITLSFAVILQNLNFEHKSVSNTSPRLYQASWISTVITPGRGHVTVYVIQCTPSTHWHLGDISLTSFPPKLMCPAITRSNDDFIINGVLQHLIQRYFAGNNWEALKWDQTLHIQNCYISQGPLCQGLMNCNYSQIKPVHQTLRCKARLRFLCTEWVKSTHCGQVIPYNSNMVT